MQLAINDLSHSYGDVLALDRVTLSIPAGIFGLLGPNGAGKSTLMRIIATLQTPPSGGVVFDEIDALRYPEVLRRTLGYLPQDFGVYPRVSAYDMLDHMAVLKGVADRALRKEVVELLLHQVKLWDVRKRALTGFSGGMRQRFGIAQALIGAPRLLIVDEPTAGLDPEERNRFLDLLAEIGDASVVILSTHIVDDVADLCSRMAVLSEGRILLEGAPQELIAELRGRIWQKTIDRGAFDEYAARHRLISTRLLAGRTIIHVASDTSPGEGFTPTAGSLQDVYFSTLDTRRHAPRRLREESHVPQDRRLRAPLPDAQPDLLDRSDRGRRDGLLGHDQPGLDGAHRRPQECALRHCAGLCALLASLHVRVGGVRRECGRAR
jgi:ABC-2 type transport system ATP-binding protein